MDLPEHCCVVTAGLLGAKVDLAALDAGLPEVITKTRLEEAERRIIELEAIVEEMRRFLAL
jgi:hypothetical protein